MKKWNILLLVLAIGAFAAPHAVLAAPEDAVEVEDGLVTGRLEVVNVGGGTVTMDGVTYEVPSGVADLSQYSAGDDVTLGYVHTETGMKAVSLSKQELG